MTDDESTLGTLVRFSRYTLTERRLVCPHCEGPVELKGGALLCAKSEREGLPAPAFKALAELAVKP